MAFTDFTNSPSNGDTVTVNGAVYTFNSTKSRWDFTPSSSTSSVTSEEVQDIVGAQFATNGSHSGISFLYDDTGDGAIDSTVNSAPTLTTARTIGGVSFDGSADIDLAGVNTTGNQNTSGNASTATALETARTIGGVSFDGSANIDLPGVNTVGNQNTSGSAATLTTARTIGGVSFDGSANISLPGVDAAGTQNTSGNAATATGLATARTIGGVSFDGTSSISLPGVNITGNQNTTGSAATLTTARTIGGVSFDGSANINLPGVNTAGTQDTSGNAGTATALETARTIGGVSFDGSANINLPGVNTGGNQNTTGSAATLTTARTIGGVSFDGSANIDLPGVNITGNQNTTGSAATLTTARTIGGVSFDGSANINLPGVNTEGNQNTTGSAATLTTARSIGGVSFDGSADIVPNIVTDTTPQLGGNLDVNGNTLTSTSNGNIEVDPNGSGLFKIKGNSTAGSGSITLNCEQNSHGIKLQGPAHSAAASYTLTFPDNDGNAEQVIQSDGSGNLSFVDQIKTVQAELTISDAASAGDVIVYESANSQYATAGETTISASRTLTTPNPEIETLGTSSDFFEEIIPVPAYGDGKVFIRTYESSTYYYRWATLNADGSTTISATASMPTDAEEVCDGPMFLVASNKLVMTGRATDTTDDNIYYNIGTINTSTGAISWQSSNSSLSNDGRPAWKHDSNIVYDSSDDKWIMVYFDDGDSGNASVRVRAITYNSSSDTLSAGTAVTVNEESSSGTETNYMGAVSFDPNRSAGLLLYRDLNSFKARKWSCSNGTITLGTSATVSNTTYGSYSPKYMTSPLLLDYMPNAGKFIIATAYYFNDGFNNRYRNVAYQSATIEENGTVTYGNKGVAVPTASFTSASPRAIAVDTDTDTAMIVYDGAQNSDQKCGIIRLTMASNGAITDEGYSQIDGHAADVRPGGIVYVPGVKKGFTYTRLSASAPYGVGTTPALLVNIQNTVTTTNIENTVIGIAEDAISAGGTGTVNLMGGVDRNQSSLTTGATYYLTSNGTLNSTADSYNIKIGVAVSATELLLEHTTSDADITAVSAGTGLTGGGTSGAVTLSLENTGVTAATYGSATTIPQIVVDAQGRVTSASNVTITAGSSIDVSDTAPSSPSSGDLWFNSSNLRPYIYYADGDSNQWIEFANSNGGGAGSGPLALGELTNVSSSSPSSGQVLKWDGSEWAPAADSTGTGGIASVAADTTPQLGGALDVNGQDIVSTSNGDIELDPNGSGVVIFKGNATKGAGQFKLNCENNSHGITIKGPPHSAAASYTLTLPNNDGDANQVLKTDGSGGLSWTTPASAGATSIDDLSDAVYNSTALSLFLGANAGAAVTNSASANVAVGVNAGDSITSANYNVLLGYNAGNAITTGSKNIVIGGQAYNATSSNGSHNILIGYNAEATSTSTNNEMTIGTASGDGLINNVRIPGVDFTMNTTALHYGAEIRADGDVVAYYSSDERLKENIQIIPNALSKVRQIRGVTFDWTDEYLEKQGGEDGYFHRKHDSGVIAQDVEKVLPELVAERPDGTKAVRYEKLVAVLIEAVKELKQEIEELKGER